MLPFLLKEVNMQIFGIILCVIIAGLFLIIGFLMDEVERWKKIAFNYKKSYEASKKIMNKTFKQINRVYSTCGLKVEDCNTKQNLNTLYGIFGIKLEDCHANRSSKRD